MNHLTQLADSILYAAGSYKKAALLADQIKHAFTTEYKGITSINETAIRDFAFQMECGRLFPSLSQAKAKAKRMPLSRDPMVSEFWMKMIFDRSLAKENK